MAILGGGLSGLAAAARLSRGGFKVTVLEKESCLGGVAANFTRGDGRMIPRSYHHILRSDTATVDILRELGLIGRVSWRKIKLKLSIDGQTLDFSGPFDLLAYRGLPLSSKLRLVLMGGRILLKKDWTDVEGLSVKDLIGGWGDEMIYRKIFVPLVDMKFGTDPSAISASWLGIRLHAGEPITLYGYMPGTSWTGELISSLSGTILENGGEIRTVSGITRVFAGGGRVSGVEVNGSRLEFDRYISTIPPHALHGMLKEAGQSSPGLDNIAGIRYVSSYNMVAASDSETFDDYWTVAHTPRRHFGACFTLDKLNPTLRAGSDKSVMNFFTYTPFDDFRFTDEEYAELCRKDASEMLGRDIRFNWAEVFRFSSTVPVYYKDYVNPSARLMDNLYLAGIYLTYPELSSSGTAMKSGIKAAERMISDMS